jgi:hypothetical protein
MLNQLGNPSDLAGNGWQTSGKRFDDGNPKTFMQRNMNEEVGGGVKLLYFGTKPSESYLMGEL